MERSFRAVLILLAGIALLATALSVQAILLESSIWALLAGLAGLALAAWGGYQLRAEFGAVLRRRRGEIVLYTVGMIGVLVMLGYLSVRFPARFDMTEAGIYSLSDQTVNMLKNLESPVHVTFFHDPMMRETVELYESMAKQTDKLTVEFYDPMVNPSQARLRGVEFAGTALMESGGRKIQINGPTETDIANGILRVSRGTQQLICFLDGHGEPDPFSLESHDHLEGDAGHSHGLGGTKQVIHERHGMAKARNGLESMNYLVEKVSLLQKSTDLSKCAVLVVAGPKTALLPNEVKSIEAYLEAGGNGFFLLDPFIKSGLEPVTKKLGVILDDTIIIDEASHFWADISAPAVSDYNRHGITRDLALTFFPGARSLSPTPQRVVGTAVRPLVNSSKRSYAETDPERVEYTEGKDIRGPNTIMVIIDRRPEFVESTMAVIPGPETGAASGTADTPPAPVVRSRVAIVGDSDFATNSFFHILGNGALFLNTINYLAAQENLIGIEPRTYDIPRVNLTNRQMKGTFFLSIILIPALMAVIGFAVWWRQR
jgi:hypothetical protein